MLLKRQIPLMIVIGVGLLTLFGNFINMNQYGVLLITMPLSGLILLHHLPYSWEH